MYTDDSNDRQLYTVQRIIQHEFLPFIAVMEGDVLRVTIRNHRDLGVRIAFRWTNAHGYYDIDGVRSPQRNAAAAARMACMAIVTKLVERLKESEPVGLAALRMTGVEI